MPVQESNMKKWQQSNRQSSNPINGPAKKRITYEHGQYGRGSQSRPQSCSRPGQYPAYSPFALPRLPPGQNPVHSPLAAGQISPRSPFTCLAAPPGATLCRAGSGVVSGGPCLTRRSAPPDMALCRAGSGVVSGRPCLTRRCVVQGRASCRVDPA